MLSFIPHLILLHRCKLVEWPTKPSTCSLPQPWGLQHTLSNNWLRHYLVRFKWTIDHHLCLFSDFFLDTMGDGVVTLRLLTIIIILSITTFFCKHFADCILKVLFFFVLKCSFNSLKHFMLEVLLKMLQMVAQSGWQFNVYKFTTLKSMTPKFRSFMKTQTWKALESIQTPFWYLCINEWDHYQSMDLVCCVLIISGSLQGYVK